jgi:long-chain acyl-CoA synthetase
MFGGNAYDHPRPDPADDPAQRDGETEPPRLDLRRPPKTWGEFGERVARIAGGLRAQGVGPEDRVAILALNSDRYLEYFFATNWAGAIFVPINIRLAPPEVIHWLTDSGAKMLIVDDTFAPMVPHLTGHTPDLTELVYCGDGDAPAGITNFEDLAKARGVEMSTRGGDDLAGLFYTGGTTGVSKGVMLSHGNLIHNAMVAQIHLNYGTDPVYLHAAPMFHLADGASTFAVTMQSGAHAFVPAFNPVATLQQIEKDKVTFATMVPVMINMMVNHPDAGKFDLSSLKKVGYGASPMPEAVLKQAMQLLPNCEFLQAYGQTDAAPLMTILPPERHVVDGPLAGKMTSVGQPCVGMDVRILDDAGAEVPRGQIGEICVQGANIMQGYWRQPELTAETTRHGWHHTGDGGYMDEDGFIFVVDRLKDMIISGGENVYSVEVENALYKHPAVIECAVIGVPDDEWGERVHAIIRLHEGAEASAEAIIAHCHDLIANYKCPRSVEFRVEPMPVSGAGKILKTELRKPFWADQKKQVH